MRRLLDGALTKEEALAFWGTHWPSALVFNTVTLPRLLERAPDVESRVGLWRAIYPEYGRGHLVKSHPFLNRTFMLALGVPEEELPFALDRDNPKVKAQIERIEAMDWLELLAFGFLGVETVGPKVFGAVADALKLHFKLSREEVTFFSVHAFEDQKDTETIFPIVARHAKTSADRDRVRAGLKQFFELDRYRKYCSDFTPAAYFFSEERRTKASKKA